MERGPKEARPLGTGLACGPMHAVGMNKGTYCSVTFLFPSHLAFHSSSGTESFTGDSEKPTSKIQKLRRTDDHEDPGSPQRLPQRGWLAL